MTELPLPVREDVDNEVVYANGLIFGPGKTGKTTACHTAPGRVLYLNWEHRNATIEARKQCHAEGRSLPVEPVLPRWAKDKTPVFDLMSAVVLQAYEGRWDTIISDHVEGHYSRLLIEQTGRARRPTLDARGNAWTDIERWCRTLVEAPVNFIVVAHEMTSQQGEQSEAIPFVGSKPASEGGFGTKLKGLVDFIAYSGVIEVEGEPGPIYVAQLRPGKSTEGVARNAGSRFASLMSEPYRRANLSEWFELAGCHTGTHTDSIAGGKQSKPVQLRPAKGQEAV